MGMMKAVRLGQVSVGAKFAVVIAVSAIVITALSASFIVHRMWTADVARSQEVARSSASRISAAVQGVFESAFDVVVTTNDSLIALKDAGIVDPTVYDTMLNRMIQAGTDRYGAWLIWEGSDAPFTTGVASQTSHDPSRRLSVYWHQNGMEMLRDAIPTEIVDSDLFHVPRDLDKAFLLEPHAINAINGDPTLVTSFSRPLEHDGKVVGALAVDLKLDAITDALSSIDLPRGASMTIVSYEGMVAASSTRAWIGKRLKEVSSETERLLEYAKHGDGTARANQVLTSWSAIRFAGVKNPW
jgi:methyl-accepting chemotaxis protein